MIKINALAEASNIDFNFSQTMIAAAVNLARTVANKLPSYEKMLACEALEDAGIQSTTRNKSFFKANTKTITDIFTRLDRIHNKIERLQMIASRVFDKNKHYSPNLITSFADGSEHPNRWMISTAITVIAMGNGSNDLWDIDEFVELWAAPLLHTAQLPLEETLSLYQEFFEFMPDYDEAVIKKINKYYRENT